jgi:diaminopropionate ammonia-lyase
MQGYTTMLWKPRTTVRTWLIKPTHVFCPGRRRSLGGLRRRVLSRPVPDNPPKCVVVEPEKAACIYASALANDGNRIR